jgi:Mlc titration factor MtfA (ptsG expression regulator)
MSKMRWIAAVVAVVAALLAYDAFLLKNPAEFFAVTASLYLYGHVDRLPFTREALREKQPSYYIWLGQLFGAQK